MALHLAGDFGDARLVADSVERNAGGDVGAGGRGAEREASAQAEAEHADLRRGTRRPQRAHCVHDLRERRGTIEVAPDADRGSIETAALAEPHVARFLEGQSVRKVIVVPGKIVNIVAAPA